MKEEALKLAEIFEEVGRAKYPYHLDAAEMLRKLVEELDKVPEVVFDEGIYRWWLPNGDEFAIVPPQTKPLSDEELDNLIIDKGHLDCVLDFHPTFDSVSVMRFELRRLARSIEERHGIK